MLVKGGPEDNVAVTLMLLVREKWEATNNDMDKLNMWINVTGC